LFYPTGPVRVCTFGCVTAMPDDAMM